MTNEQRKPREWWVRVNPFDRITSGFNTDENPYREDGFAKDLPWLEKGEHDEVIKVREILDDD